MASSAIGDDGEQFSICEAIMDTKLLEDSPVSGGGGWAMMAFFGAFGASGGATRRSTSWRLLPEWQQFESWMSFASRNALFAVLKVNEKWMR